MFFMVWVIVGGRGVLVVVGFVSRCSIGGVSVVDLLVMIGVVLIDVVWFSVILVIVNSSILISEIVVFI